MPSLSTIHHRLDTLVPLKYRSKWASFILVLIGAGLDNVNVAGSLSVYQSIVENFDTDSTTVSWTLSVYALTLGAFILLAGRLTDIVGAKAVFVWGTLISSLMVLICACIENQVIVLIVFRALQGIAASVMIPSIFPISFDYFAMDGKLPLAMTAIVIAITSANGVGLVVGGAFSLTDGGYKNFYFFSFAVGFTVSVLLYLTMYPVETHSQNKDIRIKNLDFPGTAMFIVGLLLIILGLTEGGTSWSKPAAYVPIPVGFVVVCVGLWFELVYIQRYKEKNVNDWRTNLLLLLPREALRITNIFPFICATTLLYIVYIAMLVTQTQYSQYVEGDNALIAALKALPLTVGITFGGMTTSEKQVYRVGMKRVMLGSQLAIIGLIGWFYCKDYTRKNNYWIFCFAPMFLMGWMINIYFGVYFNAVIRKTPGHLQGVVAGLMQTLGQIGICLGNSLVTTIVGEVGIAQTDAQRSALQDKFTNCLYMAWGVQGAVIIALLFIKNQKEIPSQHGLEEEEEEGTQEHVHVDDETKTPAESV